MHKIYLLVIITIACQAKVLYSQSLFINDTAYKCSETGYLEGYQEFGYASIGVFFVKKGATNHVVFESSTLIIGDVKIYLHDNTVIKLVWRNQFDCAGGSCLSIYILTNEEIEKIKKSNILMIRFATQLVINGVFNDGIKDNMIAYNKSNEPYDGFTPASLLSKYRVESDFSKILRDYFPEH